MNNTLDTIETKNNQRTFSILSFISSLITLGIVIYLISIIPRVLKVSEGFPSPPLYVIIVLYISCILGLITSVVSFRKKEPNSFYKWVGGVMNIILFFLIVGLVVFARMV